MEYPSSDEPGAKIWLPYLESADKYDRDLVEGWRDDMDSLLIFAALFSAVVTTFVVDSYRSLQRDQTMEAVSVLVQISKQLANGTQNTAFEPTPFVTPTSAVAVNICWFMSLAFSLSCALAAVMVRQWARHYLRLPRSLSATSERARMRQYLFENMVTWKLEFIVEVIPALLHISLILFFIGLLLFLHFLNSVVALCLFCFCAVGGVAYALLTIIPVVFPGSPYKTPFSRFPALVALVLWTAICSVVACITALCLSAIRFTHRSLNIPKPPPSSYWAFDRVQQIADFFGTIAIGGIGLLRKFAHIPRNIPSDAQLTQLLSLDGAERRRQLAHRKPGTRDARALRWSMAYSRNDTDFVTIVASIPGFVKSFGRFTPDAIETGDKLYGAQTLLWQTGVILRISKLLRSCVDANGAIKTGMRSVAVSCMHALHWMARCPAASPWGQEIETMPRINLTEPNAVAAYEYRLLEPWIAIDRDDPDTLLWQCCLSSLILDQVYQMEKIVRCSVRRDYLAWYGKVRIFLQMVENAARQIGYSRNGEPESIIRLMSLELPLSLLLPVVPPTSPGEFETTFRNFQRFRVRWAQCMLSSAIEWSLEEPIVLNCLADAATHLHQYPFSSTDCQLTFFRFMDDALLRFGSTDVDRIPYSLKCSFTSVLFGSRERVEHHAWSRRWMHRQLFKRVLVVGSTGKSFDISTSAVHISVHDYCKILDKLSQSFSAQSPANDDACAELLSAFIQRRMQNTNAEKGLTLDDDIRANHQQRIQFILNCPINDGLRDLLVRSSTTDCVDLKECYDLNHDQT